MRLTIGSLSGTVQYDYQSAAEFYSTIHFGLGPQLDPLLVGTEADQVASPRRIGVQCQKRKQPAGAD